MSTSSMPWIKLYTEILDDCKIGSLPDDLKWRFVSLICLAGECDANGCLVSGTGAMSADQIAWRLRITAEALEKDLAILSSAGLVILEGDIWTVKNFAQRQGRPQYERREQWREQKTDLMGKPKDFLEDSAQIPRGNKKDSSLQIRGDKTKTKRKIKTGETTAPPTASRHPAIDVYRSKANAFPIKALWIEIAETVGDQPENLERWGDVVYAYVRCGWNRSNIGGMLDWFRRGEIPHTGSGQARPESSTSCAERAIQISKERRGVSGK